MFDITILAPRNHNDLSHYHAQNEMKMFFVEVKFEETYVQILQKYYEKLIYVNRLRCIVVLNTKLSDIFISSATF